MEGFLPPKSALFWYAASSPFILYGIKKVKNITLRDKDYKIFLGVFAAFCFVVSSLKIPSVVGSSSHPVGIGLGAIFLGPASMIPVALVVLLFQAILLAHGGITTLGANLFSMGIAAAYVGYFTFQTLQKMKIKKEVSIFLSVALSDLITYVVTSFQLAFAFPDPTSGIMGSFIKFGLVFAVTQIPIAIVEGLVAIILYNYIVNSTTLKLDELLNKKVEVN
jgi:cobalt/nickel transport system permease protein